MRSSTLHGSETWPIRKENEVAFPLSAMTGGGARFLNDSGEDLLLTMTVTGV